MHNVGFFPMNSGKIVFDVLVRFASKKLKFLPMSAKNTIFVGETGVKILPIALLWSINQSNSLQRNMEFRNVLLVIIVRTEGLKVLS